MPFTHWFVAKLQVDVTQLDVGQTTACWSQKYPTDALASAALHNVELDDELQPAADPR